MPSSTEKAKYLGFVLKSVAGSHIFNVTICNRKRGHTERLQSGTSISRQFGHNLRLTVQCVASI